jgi:outer membrane receptor protein involved in Fe transport
MNKNTCRYLAWPVFAVSTGLTLIHFSSAANELEQKAEEIETISVQGQKQNQSIVKSGFNVDVLLTEDFKNGDYDLTEILKRSPGINVRSNGGLGSQLNLSLNGLSGNQIRYFFDGTPMEDFGSALSFPANLADSIEIYKGAVPVSLGADALGGAVNIATPSLDQDVLDTSYSFGSFNTHKGTVFAQQHFANDWFIRLSASAVHSDNDYEMKSVSDVDELGNVIGEMSAKRFHDQYTAGLLKVKTGMINQLWADELSLSLTYAKNRNNEQHPEKTINDVYGKYHSKNEIALSSVRYNKQFENVYVDAYLLAGEVETQFVDKESRDYDWHGNYQAQNDESRGELSDKSLFILDDKVTRGKLAAEYELADSASLQLNISHDYLRRSGEDELNPNNRAFQIPNWVRKTITGFAYQQNDVVDGLELNFFAKQYDFSGEINALEQVGFDLVDTKTQVSINETGFGSALSYQLNSDLLFKFSYENAYRLPQAQEILGTGQYVLPNSSLKPEQSDNINLGVKYELDGDDALQLFEANVFRRDSKDFIHYVAEQVVYGRYRNLQNVETTGIEASYYLNFFGNYTLQVNATYQDLINRSRVDSDGEVDLNYSNRIPNTPYWFANARLSSNFELGEHLFTTTWTTSFIEKFYLHWEGNGDRDQKLNIPSQLTHDLDVSYTPLDSDFSVTLSARNLLDAEVYDNFNIQKPGRALYIKFRYLY